jgi:hypothetical protein
MSAKIRQHSAASQNDSWELRKRSASAGLPNCSMIASYVVPTRSASGSGEPGVEHQSHSIALRISDNEGVVERDATNEIHSTGCAVFATIGGEEKLNSIERRKEQVIEEENLVEVHV